MELESEGLPSSTIHQYEDMEKEVEKLELENNVLELFLARNAEAELLQQEAEKKSASSRKRRAQVPVKLTKEQKAAVAVAELETARNEVMETEKASQKVIDTLRAVLIETDTRISELKKDAYEFKRDIVVGAENPRTGKIMAEKLQKYIEDKLRQQDALAEKLRLKNATLKNQIRKAEVQLRQKDDMGDALHYIDYHQLQIENKQYLSQIEERNEELLHLKMTTGKAVQKLNSLKHELHQYISENEWLRKEIKARSDALAKIKAETANVEADAEKARRTNKKKNQNIGEGSQMPDLDAYIAQKAKAYELQQALSGWERKMEIAELGLKSAQAQRRRAMES
jgi:hypothetical protein